MSDTNLPARTDGRAVVKATAAEDMFVTVAVAGQLFGIPVLAVRDVLSQQRITHIPLAPPEVAGALNLRGRIVTAIDVRARLLLPPRDDGTTGMSVVVDLAGELYSLIVDRVGEVMTLPSSDFERSPPTLDVRWQEVSTGVYRLPEGLLVVLDVARLLRLQNHKDHAA